MTEGLSDCFASTQVGARVMAEQSTQGHSSPDDELFANAPGGQDNRGPMSEDRVVAVWTGSKEEVARE